MEDREYNRISEIINTSRKYHIRNIIVASISVALLFKTQNEILKLFLDIELPVKLLVFVLHIIVVGLTTITIDSFLTIWPIIKKQQNNVPFNWFILNNYQSKLIPLFFLIAPYLISVISFFQSEIIIDKEIIVLIGLVFIMTPSNLREIESAIKKTTIRKETTLSMFVYRRYKFLKFLLFITLLSLIVIVSISKGKVNEKWIYYIAYVWMGVHMIRLIWDLKFIYANVNRLGEKWGFKGKSNKHQI